MVKTKFTFDFEIYSNALLKGTVQVVALSDSVGVALEAAINGLKEQLNDDETFRYTGKFRKQLVTEVPL